METVSNIYLLSEALLFYLILSIWGSNIAPNGLLLLLPILLVRGGSIVRSAVQSLQAPGCRKCTLTVVVTYSVLAHNRFESRLVWDSADHCMDS